MTIIAIVGGGAAGVSTLVQLTTKLIDTKTTDVEILVIEKSGKVGPGLAYAPDDNSHIINLPAKSMSPIPGKPDDFINWLNKNEEKWKHLYPNVDLKKSQFPPRTLFGIYLENLAQDTKKHAEQNSIKVTFLKDEVVDIEKTVNADKKFSISVAGNTSKMSVDQIILCIGHLPSTEYTDLTSNPGYFHSPWPTQHVGANIPKTADVVILGTRLTAIDIAVALSTQGHTGKIALVSRYGLIPCVIGISKHYTKEFLSSEKIDELTAYGTQTLTLDTVKKLFLEEVKIVEGHEVELDKLLKPAITTKSAEKWLKNQIFSAKNSVRNWQSLLASLYPIVPKIWNVLDTKSKEEFLKKYYSLWMTYLAAFPIDNAEKILTLIEKGQLEVYGKLETVTFNSEKENFDISLDAGKKIINASYVINGTGAGHDITKTNSTLLKNLLVRGLIVPHPLGGIDVDFKTLNAIGKTSEQRHNTENFFVIGDATWGACMATADLGQIGREAQRVVNSSIQQIKIQDLDKASKKNFLDSHSATLLSLSGADKEIPKPTKNTKAMVVPECSSSMQPDFAPASPTAASAVQPHQKSAEFTI